MDVIYSLVFARVLAESAVPVSLDDVAHNLCLQFLSSVVLVFPPSLPAGHLSALAAMGQNCYICSSLILLFQ